MVLTGAAVVEQPGRKVRREMEVADDLKLLEEIAQHRDRAAFNELFSRYEKRAYSLAHHLTHNHELAQDALQDAMLDIWLHASTHRSGKVGSWILRIVANKSITLAQRRKKEGKRMDEHATADIPAQNASPADFSEREELLGVLRASLERLPLLDRQALALRYAGGLTQVEIGEALLLSNVAISNRLAKACDQVRGHLTQAGYAAVLPLVSAEGLGEALSSGYEMPPGLHEQILEHATIAVRESLRMSVSHLHHATAAKWSLPAKLVAGIAVAASASVSGVLWWKNANVPPPASAPMGILFEDRAEYGVAPWTLDGMQAEHVLSEVDGKKVWVLRMSSAEAGRLGAATTKLQRLAPAMAIEFFYMAEEFRSSNNGSRTGLWIRQANESQPIFSNLLLPDPNATQQRSAGPWQHYRVEYYNLGGQKNAAGKPILTRIYIDGKLMLERRVTGTLEGLLFILHRDRSGLYRDLRVTEIEPLKETGPE